MTINDINAKRSLIIEGSGWNIREIDLEYIGRYACSGSILDEEDFEWEEGDLIKQEKYLSFSNSLNLILKNFNSGENEKYEFKNLKKLAIYRGELDPEDLILTNSFHKIPKQNINHWEYTDEEYYLEVKDSWCGIYGKFNFDKGESLDIKNINIIVSKIDNGSEFYEWVCNIEYKEKFIEILKNRSIKRYQRLRIRSER